MDSSLMKWAGQHRARRSRVAAMLGLATLAASTWGLSPAAARVDPVQKPSDAPALATGTGLDFDRIARELVAACPLADDADAKARDAAGAKLAHCEALLGRCGETILWGGFEAQKGYDPRAYTLTEFAPMVWARLYLSQFMFTGEYAIRTEQSFQVLELTAKFRRNLDPGDYPYPLWHSVKKWQAHINVASIILVAKDGEIIAAFRKPDSNPLLPDRKWDGRWHWTSPDGKSEPRVTLFEYLLSPDNPHRAPLEASYRKLEAGFRTHGCISCHAPDNPAQANPLVLLLYPNQSLGARHTVVDELSRNHMPPADPTTGAPQGIGDDETRAALILLAQEFAREGDAALAFERQSGRPATAVVEPQTMPADQSTWKTLRDDWYSLTLAGERSGWMRVAREDDGTRYRSVTEMTLSFHRNGMDLDADSFVEWVESHDGQPLHLKISKRNKAKLTNFDIGSFSAWDKTRNGDPLGLLTTTKEWEFDGDKVTRIGRRGDEPIKAPAVRPGGPWLTPVAAEQFILRRIKDDARAIEYGTIDAPDDLRFVTVKSSLVGRADFPLQGELIPVTVWRTQTSVNPAQTISHYSSEGKLMYSSSDLGIGLLETRMSTKEEALARLQPATAPQISLPGVRPNGEVAPGTHNVFEVRLKEGKLPHLPSAGAQTVEMSEDGTSARVTVDSTKTSAATNPELTESRLREQSPVVGSDDPLVLELAAQAVRESEGLGNRELATSSRTIVHRHFAQRTISSPPGPMAAAGLQFPETGAEQARMLGAVLRVHRIASRAASGLAYAGAGGDGVFQWRVWTQALVDGQWMDLDPSDTDQFSAGHILTGRAVSASVGADPDPGGFVKLLQQVEIKVISTEPPAR